MSFPAADWVDTEKYNPVPNQNPELRVSTIASYSLDFLCHAAVGLGMVRLRSQGKGMVSFFKKNAVRPWGPMKVL